jgi:hypothetical protein
MPYAFLDPSLHAVQSPTVEALARLAAEAPPPGLLIQDYRLPTFEPLLGFPDLRRLKISGAPKVSDLSPLGRLTALGELVLGTPTGSSGSGRVIDVASFAPLEALHGLERLVLMGVRPRDLDLAPIARMRQLKELDIDGVKEFGLAHYARLAAALLDTTGRTLVRRFLCVSCQAGLIEAHVARWNRAKADAAASA